MGYLENQFGTWFFDDIVEWVADNLSPTDIFKQDILDEWAREWAEDNGYVLEDELED